MVASAQSGEPFCCVTEGAELTYASTNPKGKETGSVTVTKIKSVSGREGNFDITQVVTLYEKGEQLLAPTEIQASVKGGNVSVALGGGAVIQASGNVPVIPSRLEEGMDLGTGEMVVTMGIIKATQTITSHKVIAKEEVTVPAGTFDCFVVEQQYTSKLGPIKSKGIQRIWYARGVGNVKSETCDPKGKVVSVQVLKEFKK